LCPPTPFPPAAGRAREQEAACTEEEFSTGVLNWTQNLDCMCSLKVI
jgi:hypothetical protein